MRLVVLSRSKRVPSTRRLVEVALARGHEVRVLSPARVELLWQSDEARLMIAGRRLAVPDVVIPRLAAAAAGHALPVVEQLQMSGAVVLNSARSIGQAQNPARCLQRLAAQGLRIPATVMVREASSLRKLVQQVGGVPLQIRLVNAGGRRSLLVCESLQTLEAALEALQGLGHDLVVQEHPLDATLAVRVLVVGGAAVAAVQRPMRPGRRGRLPGASSPMSRAELDPHRRAAAEKTAKVLDLEVCAVDLLEAEGSPPRVCEVDASPALPAIEAATGVDLARAIVERAEVLASGRRPMASSG